MIVGYTSSARVASHGGLAVLPKSPVLAEGICRAVLMVASIPSRCGAILGAAVKSVI
jgi:hypothetical protein